MTPQPSPEHIELAIELVLYVDPVRLHAARADSFLQDIGADDLDRDCIAMEIDDRFGTEIPSQEARDWLTIRDIAATLAAIPAVLQASS